MACGWGLGAGGGLGAASGVLVCAGVVCRLLGCYLCEASRRVSRSASHEAVPQLVIEWIVRRPLRTRTLARARVFTRAQLRSIQALRDDRAANNQRAADRDHREVRDRHPRRGRPQGLGRCDRRPQGRNLRDVRADRRQRAQLHEWLHYDVCLDRCGADNVQAAKTVTAGKAALERVTGQ